MMDGATMREKPPSYFVELGRLHPGPYQADMPHWAKNDPSYIETMQWCDGALWWECEQRKRRP